MIAFFDMLMKAFAPITNFFNQMTEFCIHLLQVLRAKMSIAHEKELHINQKNVYPTVKKLPTPLCCFKIMHIRTGTLWIAYCEIMWIVSQCSFWTAESIVRKAFPPVVIMTGFAFTCLQLDSEERANSQQFFHRFLIGKLIFTGVYTCLKGFALYTAYRCYSYIAKTRRAVGHLTIFEEPNIYSQGYHHFFYERMTDNHTQETGCA
uniref:Uncharacterized protein n=1 Tax=Caenorhabditis japonica TaxID=281687 RepID=A0A8R1HNP9_CAEJA